MSQDAEIIRRTPGAKVWDLGPIREKIGDDPRLLRQLEEMQHELNSDERRKVAEILSYTEASKARMLEAMNLAAAAKRRKWAADDHLEECRQQLARAESAAEVARKDFLEAREQMRSFWDIFFRPEVEAIPTTDQPATT